MHVAMPTFGYCSKVVNFSILCSLLVICTNATEPVNQEEDQPLSYCMLGPDEEGASRFNLGAEEHNVCRRGRFFDYTPDDGTLRPKGCTLCPRGTHYMDMRNFCPQCKACRVCNGHEVQTHPCTAIGNRKCAERSSQIPDVPSNVTGATELETTTVDITTGAGVTLAGTASSSSSSSCPPSKQCTPCTAISQAPLPTMIPEQEKQCPGVPTPCIASVVLLVLAILLIMLLIITVLRLKKQEGGDGNNPAPNNPNIDEDSGDQGRNQSVNPPSSGSQEARGSGAQQSGNMDPLLGGNGNPSVSESTV